MALPSWLRVPMGGRRFQRPGPSPTLGSVGLSHHRPPKSWVSLRCPPCAHDVLGIPFGEVIDIWRWSTYGKVNKMKIWYFFICPCIQRYNSSISTCEEYSTPICWKWLRSVGIKWKNESVWSHSYPYLFLLGRRAICWCVDKWMGGLYCSRLSWLYIHAWVGIFITEMRLCCSMFVMRGVFFERGVIYRCMMLSLIWQGMLIWKIYNNTRLFKVLR
jgi:hypothetical protein